MGRIWTTVWILGIISGEIVQFSLCQFGPLRAATELQVETASVGTSVVLTCSSETGVPLGICLWERKGPLVNEGDAKLVTFTMLNARPDLPSAIEGYTYAGEGLLKGTCGLKINKVQEDDFKDWQCTLIGDNKTYRGSIKLQKSENEEPEKLGGPNLSNMTSAGTASAVYSNTLDPKAEERQAKEFEFSVGTGSISETKPIQRQGRPRPVITAGSVTDSDFSRAFRPSIAAAPTGAQVEEVQVQSAGLIIIPRKSRKLIIIE